MQRTMKVREVTITTMVENDGNIYLKDFTHTFYNADSKEVNKYLTKTYGNFLIVKDTKRKAKFKMKDETFVAHADSVEFDTDETFITPAYSVEFDTDE